ncbi:MAG: ABC transporter ATP-binding protein/permease [Actinomycetota bacterium]|nr:ABC transporter ATP-binding protein/permease [Actinomycetota bacterium]MDQ2956308.1 ABC transporter ATP-binding protein/permease [Actinomycetota bacterium]
MLSGRSGYAAILRSASAAVRLGWDAARLQLVAVLGLSIVDGAVPVAAAWSLRLLLDSMTGKGDSQPAASIAVAGIVLCGFFSVVARAGQTYLQTVMQRRVRTMVEARLFRAIHAVPGLAAFEDPEKLDQLRMAEQAGESAPEGVISSGLSLAQAAVTGAGFVIAILLLYPWLVLVVAAAAVPTCLLQLRMARLRAGVLMETSVYHRRLIFYRYLAVDVRAAKEVRLFGLGEYLIGRMLGELGSSNRAEAVVDRAAARIELAIGMLSGLVTLCGASAAAYLASRHRLTVGDVTVLLAAIVALQATVAAVTESVSTGYRSLLLFQQYLAVAEPGVVTDAGTAEVAELVDCIEFDDVWFRYADELPWALRGVSCRLPAGQSVGLVGLNGAGKTTMVKLLCRLYEPDRGCIRWDGVDISTIDPVLLRSRISAVFQDFMAYDFTAADNIAIGSLDALGDLERIREAAVRAGVDATVQGLPRGYQTMLSRIFPPDEEGGRNAALSGGEWQRLALARAFLRAEADVLILDEPSSGLDAQVEHELNRTLRTFRAGRLSVLISHRLSALSTADLILVLDDGVIIERGSPAELTASGGMFAELFALQAEGYQLPAAQPVPPRG